jgi:hypothetical protein
MRRLAAHLAAVAFVSATAMMVHMALTASDGLAQPSHLRFQVPTTSLFYKSPMLLIEDPWRTDLDYVRGYGVAAEPAAPGLVDRALRIGSTLVLKIDGDRVLRIFDLPDRTGETGPSLHHFQAWLPRPRLYVVSVTCNECPQWVYLIDARDASVAVVENIPRPSPSGEYAVMWSGWNFLSGDIWPSLLDLRQHPVVRMDLPWRPCGKSSEQAGKRLPERWPLFEVRPSPRWLDDSRLAFEGQRSLPAFAGDPNATQILRIVEGGTEWEC